MTDLALTHASMSSFLDFEKSRGASDNMLSRFKAAVCSVYDFLPEDKQLSKERLAEWRSYMDSKGYAYQTVQNYVKYFNRYLDYAGLSEIRFNRGRGKDIAGVEFGFITAIEPTDKRDRGDVIWSCRCRCGNMLEITATRLILNNTLSCGCIQKESIKRINKFFDGTSLEKSLKDPVTSERSMSGYVGVTRKKDRWQAYITYKKKRIYLGVYDKLEDAVKARARGKQVVMEDAADLLEIYRSIHENDEPLPKKSTEPKREFVRDQRVINDQPTTASRRSDNTSGYTGIAFRQNRWDARISYNKTRYMLGRFNTVEDAVNARITAENMLKTDPAAFVDFYSKRSKNPTA